MSTGNQNPRTSGRGAVKKEKEYKLTIKQSARMCGESFNICHDCTDAYRHEMQLQERCDRKTWWGFAAKTRRGDACTTN